MNNLTSTTTFKHWATHCFSLALLASPAGYAASPDVENTDEHIKQIVQSLLKEKDEKIQQLEARIQQLEQTDKSPPAPSNTASAPSKPAPTVAVATPAADTASPAKPIDAEQSKATASMASQLGDLGDQIAELKQAAEEKGLKISGFFDVNAKTDNSTEQNFSVGSVELDLEYAYNDHFAASSALVLCGNSSGAEFSAPAAITCGGSGPGGIGAGGAGIAVALVDYHMFDGSIPPRGRIFNGQGFHIQAGRFDIPFSTDYQNFANTDRVTITAPITTSRMQFGGYNGDGIRTYGAWKLFNFSAFWTDAMYANDGTSLGGRLGMTIGQNTYRIHNANPEGIEVGVSHLSDLDKNRNIRHSVYGADLSFGYSFLRLQSELMWLQSHHAFIGPDNFNYGKGDELGYHATLIANLENFIDKPLLAFVRYGRWQPDVNKAEDFDGSLVAVNNVSALTVGVNYTFNEHFKIKFEYTDSLGTSTQEHYFDKKLGIAQMVVAF
ncbi:MAG: hypothetical protein ABL925_12275 [Methylococcales bacterium]